MNIMKKSKEGGHIYCPKDASRVPRGKGKFMWQAMALPFHLIGKTCKKCGEQSADHIIVIEE